MRVGRRQFVGTLAALGASALSLPYARRARAAAAPLTTVRLSDAMVAVIGPDSNALCADGPDGLVLVDGGHAAWSGALLETLEREFPGRPVRGLLNTHWHPEQTGSNETLGARGVEIVAHENTKLWLGSEVWVRWSDRKYPPLPPVALPTSTLYESSSIDLAGRTLECGYLRDAHTDGDLFVRFPEENVVVAGGLVSNTAWPVIDWWTGGWTGGMLNGFDALLAVVDDATRIVPAHGPVMSRAELEAQRAMYAVVFERIHGMLLKAYSTDEVLAAKPTAEYDARYGDPTLFVTLAFQSTWGHLRDAHDRRLRNIP